MKIQIANSPKLEIPDSWIEETCFALSLFQKKDSYLTLDDRQINLLSIGEIEPPTRNTGVPYFVESRMKNILRALVQNMHLPPIHVQKTPNMQEGFTYMVRDGTHRYYASVAAGFEKIPAIILPYFNIAKS